MGTEDDRIEQRLRRLFSSHRSEATPEPTREETSADKAPPAAAPSSDTTPAEAFETSMATKQDLPTLTVAEYEQSAAEHAANFLPVVHFLLGESHFAVPLAEVREVQMLPTLTRVPNAEASVVGLVNLRGTVVSVIDVRARLSLEVQPSSSTARILVFDGGGQPVGVLVDAVLGPAQLPLPLLDPPVGNASDLLVGVVELDSVPITVLHTEKLIAWNA